MRNTRGIPGDLKEGVKKRAKRVGVGFCTGGSEKRESEWKT